MTIVSLHPNVRSMIVFTWSLTLIFLGIYLVCWFALSLFFLPLVDLFTASHIIQPPWDSIMTLLKNIFLWSPAIAIFGWALFAILSSSRHDVETWSE